jgi:NAD(P)H-dependent flavin oxidoreductase YrpB (nitropropane dioxygenase family)
VTRDGLGGLGVGLPVLAAPMAGGPSTPALVVAAARAGGLGFLAAGYRTPEDLAGQIAEVRASGVPFGVNVFAPTPVPVDPGEYAAYARAIRAEGEPYGVDPTTLPLREDDDAWQAKVDLLVADPVPVVGFTFGLPPEPVVRRLQQAGSVVVQTVTDLAEARAAAGAGVDVLLVQSAEAGAHSGTWTPEQLPEVVPAVELVAAVAGEVDLPLWAAGGLATADDVRRVLGAGAETALVGTALLRADEAGTSATYRAALADPARHETVLTRAFSGRPARALRNRFVDRYADRAPSGYPAVHHLTTPIRRAAAAAGDPERINIWAGTGVRLGSDGPVAEILAGLANV